MVERVRQTAVALPPRERAAHAIAEEGRRVFERPLGKEADPYMNAAETFAKAYQDMVTGKFINGGKRFARLMSNPGSDDGTTDIDLRTNFEAAAVQFVGEYIKKHGVPVLPSDSSQGS